MEIISKFYLSQYTLFGGFAPTSETAKVLSENLGYQTVLSGSVSKGKNDPSQSLQMIQRPLMTTDELKAMPKGNFILMKTGKNPMKTKLKIFFKWGIKLDTTYQIDDRQERPVHYVNVDELESIIVKSLSTYNHEEILEKIYHRDKQEKRGVKVE